MSDKLNKKELQLAQAAFKRMKVTKVVETPDETIIYITLRPVTPAKLITVNIGFKDE